MCRRTGLGGGWGGAWPEEAQDPAGALVLRRRTLRREVGPPAGRAKGWRRRGPDRPGTGLGGAEASHSGKVRGADSSKNETIRF